MADLTDSRPSADAQIDYSSVPAWARPHSATAPFAPNDSASVQVLVAVGPEAASACQQWRGLIGATTAVVEISERDLGPARLRLQEVLSTARVGMRLVLTGSDGDCLALRAAAIASGLEDDEISVVAGARGRIDVFCPHCRAVNHTDAQVGETIGCTGCSRNLVIYYHVSRRSGHYLGYQVDAETAPVR